MDYKDLTEQQQIERLGHMFFNRYGEDEWATHNSFYSAGYYDDSASNNQEEAEVTE